MKPEELKGHLDKLTGKAREKHAQEIAADMERRDLILAEINRIDDLKRSGATQLEIARTTSETLIEKLGESGDLIRPRFEVIIESGRHEQFGEYNVVARLTSYKETEQCLVPFGGSSDTSYFLAVGLAPQFLISRKIDDFFKDDEDQLALKKVALEHSGWLPWHVENFISVQELKSTDREVSDEFSSWTDRMLVAACDRIVQKITGSTK